MEMRQDSISSKISIPFTQAESTYDLKPRRAKENRFLHFEDFAVQPIARKT